MEGRGCKGKGLWLVKRGGSAWDWLNKHVVIKIQNQTKGRYLASTHLQVGGAHVTVADLTTGNKVVAKRKCDHVKCIAD